MILEDQWMLGTIPKHKWKSIYQALKPNKLGKKSCSLFHTTFLLGEFSKPRELRTHKENSPINTKSFILRRVGGP